MASRAPSATRSHLETRAEGTAELAGRRQRTCLGGRRVFPEHLILNLQLYHKRPGLDFFFYRDSDRVIMGPEVTQQIGR